MAQLYTPFLADTGKIIGQGIKDRRMEELTKKAYMGDEAALQQLASVNPQLASQIRREKISKQQLELDKKRREEEQKRYEKEQERKDIAYQTEQNRYAEEQNIKAEERKKAALTENREYVDATMEEAAKLPSYEEAKAYVARRVQENPQLAEFSNDYQLTEEVYNQSKKVYGDQAGGAFEGKSMDAQVSSMLVKGVNDPEFRKTPEYERAYQLASEAKIIRTPTGDIQVPPNLPNIFKRPGKELPEKDQVKQIENKAKTDKKSIEYIPGTERAEKFTEGEKLSAGFYERMTGAEKSIEELGAFDPSSLMEIARGATNVTASEKMQSYRQAASDWIRSKLRKESGAVIGKDEMDKEYETYFPILGDSDKVIEQKRKARETARESMRKNAGQMIKESKEPQKQMIDEQNLTVTYEGKTYKFPNLQSLQNYKKASGL